MTDREKMPPRGMVVFYGDSGRRPEFTTFEDGPNEHIGIEYLSLTEFTAALQAKDEEIAGLRGLVGEIASAWTMRDPDGVLWIPSSWKEKARDALEKWRGK